MKALYLDRAIKAAHSGIHRRYKVGAILVNSGKVISEGANSYKTHPKMGVKTLHAEIQALIGVRYKDLVGSTVYVARLNKNHKLGMARPCETCRHILKEYGIKRCFFTNQLGLVERLDL
jgi:cytidine deaminase